MRGDGPVRGARSADPEDVVGLEAEDDDVEGWDADEDEVTMLGCKDDDVEWFEDFARPRGVNADASSLFAFPVPEPGRLLAPVVVDRAWTVSAMDRKGVRGELKSVVGAVVFKRLDVRFSCPLLSAALLCKDLEGVPLVFETIGVCTGRSGDDTGTGDGGGGSDIRKGFGDGGIEGVSDGKRSGDIGAGLVAGRVDEGKGCVLLTVVDA